MLCYSCSKQKDELHPCKSSLLDGVQLFMCQSCIDGKYEPRWVVILAGRQKGSEYVREYIVKRRYFGRPIAAEEVIA